MCASESPGGGGGEWCAAKNCVSTGVVLRADDGVLLSKPSRTTEKAFRDYIETHSSPAPSNLRGAWMEASLTMAVTAVGSMKPVVLACGWAGYPNTNLDLGIVTAKFSVPVVAV